MVDNDLRKRFQFFLENAGYCTPPGRAACALELARTERLLDEALELDCASVEWVDDESPYDYDPAVDSPEDVVRRFESNEWTGPYGCIVKAGIEATEPMPVNDPDFASLWGIVVGPRNTNDPYCRVVAAQLAAELEDELRQAIGDKRDADEWEANNIATVEA